MEGALARLGLLKPKRFNFLATPGETIDGFLAHEAQEVVPNAVEGQKDEVEEIGDWLAADGSLIAQGVRRPDQMDEGQSWVKTGDGDRPKFQAIDHSKLVPLLTAAVQELLARVEALEAQLAGG